MVNRRIAIGAANAANEETVRGMAIKIMGNIAEPKSGIDAIAGSIGHIGEMEFDSLAA